MVNDYLRKNEIQQVFCHPCVSPGSSIKITFEHRPGMFNLTSHSKTGHDIKGIYRWVEIMSIQIVSQNGAYYHQIGTSCTGVPSLWGSRQRYVALIIVNFHIGRCVYRERNASSAKANVRGILNSYKTFLDKFGHFMIRGCAHIGPVADQKYSCNMHVLDTSNTQVMLFKSDQSILKMILDA